MPTINRNTPDDYLELAAHILGISEDEFNELVNDGDEDQIELRFFEKFDFDYDLFPAIVDALMPLTMPIQKAISGDLTHAFGRFDKIGFRTFTETDSTLKLKNKEDNKDT